MEKLINGESLPKPIHKIKQILNKQEFLSENEIIKYTKLCTLYCKKAIRQINRTKAFKNVISQTDQKIAKGHFIETMNLLETLALDYQSNAAEDSYFNILDTLPDDDDIKLELLYKDINQ